MNNNTAVAKPAVMSALRKGQAVIAIGDVYGWPRPQAYADAIEMLYAARAAERTVTSLPPLPEKPKDMQKWIDATVDIRHQEATRRDVIDEVVLTWEPRSPASARPQTSPTAS
jgi:hypothetical protein